MYRVYRAISISILIELNYEAEERKLTKKISLESRDYDV